MSRSRSVRLLAVVAFVLAGPVFAASYMPLSDADLVRRSPVVVLAHVVEPTDFAAARKGDFPCNLTRFRSLETLKGEMPATFQVRLGGGELPDGTRSWLPGTPTFEPGQEVLLFLAPNPDVQGEYRLTELALSKFDVMEDADRRLFAVRPSFLSGEETYLSTGAFRYDAPEEFRDLDSFMAALREAGKGGALPEIARTLPNGTLRVHVRGPLPNWVNIGGNENANNLFRWFWDTGFSPNAVLSINGTQTNMSDGQGGTPQVQNAATQWHGVASSDVRYSCGPNCQSAGNVTVNLDVVQDPNGSWSTPMDCSLGVLGVAGPQASAPKQTFKGDQYYYVTSGNVWMRKNICSSGYSANVFRSAILHEVGHTVGLGHPDQAASSHSTTSSTDWNNAVMRSSLPNSLPSSPQTDDIQAIQYYYPGSGAPAPTILTVLPTSGPTTGGTLVTITGTNFVSGATVTFGGTAATNVNVATSATITCNSPAHGAGAVDVTVSNPGGGSATKSSAFTYTSSGSCSTGGTNLCVQQNRFRINVNWTNRYVTPNQSGAGTAVQVTSDTGYFWFFNSANVEMIIKVLDGRSVNGKFWVFYGALTDVEYTIFVNDTQTGFTKQYFSQNGHLGSLADTSYE